ncbi:MAG: ferritin-like domain-containing protein [Deltaproteobacteria bacterium]|nr:ferritin-like domain-containing protein [Deltaproteobacteria bacterium]MBI3387445.1 ferritin-like domain-containing protein [Deltaproteobacteria bacterium]
MVDQITYDPIYNTVAPDDFPAMLEVDRYGDRTGAFDSIIAATHDHFWDPTDPVYVNFEQPFDLSADTILPKEMVPELNSAVADRLDAQQRIELANESTRWVLSSILHGEQGALSLSASLCQLLRDPGAQEYAANQVREEARHVTAYAAYMKARWGAPLPAGHTLKVLLNEMVTAPEVYKKLVGMQMLVEGLAMGAFATLHSRAKDPLLVKLTQLVMTDEAFHHKFGKIWADRTIPKLTEEEHQRVEDWAAQCFQTLLFNLINAEQKQIIYARFDLDWQWVRAAVMEAFTDDDRRRLMKQSNNIFRVLIKTLLKAGIITERTRGLYAMWVDMDELAGESDEMVGDPIAMAGIEYLRDINRNRKRIGRALNGEAASAA